MKLVYKRSSAATALAVPEETYVSEPAYQEPSPAPAGALHRVYPPGQTNRVAEEDPYIPQRGSYGMRLRGGLPRGVAGRILLGGGAFAVLGTLVLTVAAVRSFLLHDPRFLLASSTAITIQGNDHIPRSEILSVFGSDLERNIFRVPLDQRRSDLERLPWVAHATVMRLLPNRIRVQLTERTPVAFTRQGTQIGLVDADGVLLDMPPDSAGDPHYSFPVLTGLAPNDTPEVRAVRMEVYRRFMTDLGSLGPKVTQSLSEVDVTNPEDVKALIATSGSDILVHFGDESFLPRYQAFEQHLAEWRQQYPRLASADMRYERQVVLEMQPGTATPLASEIAPSAPPAPVAPAKPVSAAPAVHHAAPVRVAQNQRGFTRMAAARRLAQLRAQSGVRR